MKPEAIRITASHIAYLLVCNRKLWLYSSGVEMEHFSSSVLEGRLINNTSYPRRPSNFVQIELDAIKIDFYDPSTRTVYETKRGRGIETAHIAQVQYYLYKLRQYGISNANGIIEYPDLRKREMVPALTDADYAQVEVWERQVVDIVTQAKCPPVIDKPYCKKCAYYDFCYITTDE